MVLVAVGTYTIALFGAVGGQLGQVLHWPTVPAGQGSVDRRHDRIPLSPGLTTWTGAQNPGPSRRPPMTIWRRRGECGCEIVGPRRQRGAVLIGAPLHLHPHEVRVELHPGFERLHLQGDVAEPRRPERPL